MYAKNVREHNRFVLFLLEQRVAKKAARKRNVFLKEEKTVKRKYSETCIKQTPYLMDTLH